MSALVLLLALACVGFIVGRWWVLLLALVPALYALPMGDTNGIPAAVGALVGYGQPIAVALAAGVGMRKLAGNLRARRSA
jgi:hypothetical protein